MVTNFPGVADSKKDDGYSRHLASIVESSDDAIISESLTGIKKSWDTGGEKMFGYTADEAVVKIFLLSFNPIILMIKKYFAVFIAKSNY